ANSKFSVTTRRLNPATGSFSTRRSTIRGAFSASTSRDFSGCGPSWAMAVADTENATIKPVAMRRNMQLLRAIDFNFTVFDDDVHYGGFDAPRQEWRVKLHRSPGSSLRSLEKEGYRLLASAGRAPAEASPVRPNRDSSGSRA